MHTTFIISVASLVALVVSAPISTAPSSEVTTPLVLRDADPENMFVILEDLKREIFQRRDVAIERSPYTKDASRAGLFSTPSGQNDERDSSATFSRSEDDTVIGIERREPRDQNVGSSWQKRGPRNQNVGSSWQRRDARDQNVGSSWRKRGSYTGHSALPEDEEQASE